MSANGSETEESPVTATPAQMDDDPWGWQRLLEQPPRQTPQSPYAQQPAPPSQPYAQPAQEPEKRKKWPFFLGGGLILLCVLLAAGYLAYRGTILTHTETVWGPVGSRVESKYTLFGRELLETSYYSQTPDGAGGGVSSVAIFSADNARLREDYYDPGGAYTGWADFIYDKNGVLVEKIGYDTSGAQVYAETYTYDADGTLTKMVRQDTSGSTETDYGADGQATDVYSYNLDGNITEEIHYSSDGAGSYMSFRQTYTYDASGSLVKMDSYTRGVLLRTETTYGPDGAVSGTTQYTYDDSGNLVKTSGYDANNNLVEEDDYDARGAVAARWAYAYDAQGNKIKASSYQGEDRLISETSYDASGAVTQRVEYRYDGGGAHTYMLTYDAAGRLTEEFDYNVPAGSLTPDRWAYTYDDAGNFLYKEGMLAAASWDWSEKTVTLSSYYSYPVVLAQPIPNCVGFTLDYEMHDISYGNPYGKQNIYIKTDAGSWKKVGSINVPDDNTATAAVTLSDPTGVAAVAVIPSTAKNTSWTCWFNPYNFIIRSTEPFTETVFTA